MKVFSIKLPDLPVPAIKCELSFLPYLQYIEAQIDTTASKIYKTYLQSIAKLIRENDELMQPVCDWDQLTKHAELTELLKITHLSQVDSDNKLHAFGLPGGNSTSMNFFSWSDEFEHFFNSGSDRFRPISGEAIEHFLRQPYIEILSNCYPQALHKKNIAQTTIQFVDTSAKVKKYYKVVARRTFAKIVPDGELPPFRQEWADYANGRILSYAELKEPIPFSKFRSSGFFLFSIIDNTEEMAVSELRSAVAQMHEHNHLETYQNMIESSQSLIADDAYEMGFIPFFRVNDKVVYHKAFADFSIVFSRLKQELSLKQAEKAFTYLSDLREIEHDVFTSICTKNEEACMNKEEELMMDLLFRKDLKSLTLIPIKKQGKVLGLIELGTNEQEKVSPEVVNKIVSASAYYREYLSFNIRYFDEALKSFIMKRYTSIQPAVQWKFNEQAWNAFLNIKGSKKMETMVTPGVRFNNLYPFYGAVDYRNSSLKQLYAIHSDFLLQLDYLRTILQEVNDKKVDAFKSQIADWEERVKVHMNYEDEYELHHFLEIEALRLLNDLCENGMVDKLILDEYRNGTFTQDGIFHSSHADYEQSLQSMNTILKTALNEAEEKLQKLIPHYFEKFQTDGIEYSMYVGQSIAPDMKLPGNVLDLVAAWQVDTMLAMARAALNNTNKLKVPLDTTQLILIHENKVDISYRVDEKHFDVEGSYSIRYEVIKKRIDKVKLRNSEERLTQPNTIAIVYAHKDTYRPYLNRVEQLIEKGEFQNNIEFLELEQLQGVGKLKAIRVHIDTGEPLLKKNTKDASRLTI